MTRINLTTIQPESTTIHHAFDEVRDSLAWALAACGHSISLTENTFSESGELNLILGAELIADFQRLPPATILYNLEQPSHPALAKLHRFAAESGCTVWDYSLRATDEWRAAGITATHVPIGYTPNLTRIPPSPPDIDVFFAGHPTPRRTELVDSLRSSGLTVAFVQSCYGGARDQLISRSRLCLNVHHDGRDRFEAVRCSYLMANARCLVTEVSADDDEYSALRGLTRVPYRLLADSIHSLLASDAERARLAEQAAASIRERDLVATIRALDLPAAPSRTLARRAARQSSRRGYLASARDLSSPAPDPRVATRYSAACTSGDMSDFAAYLRSVARGNIMEIGVRDGASTSAFLSGLESAGGHLYSVDVQPCGHLFDGHPQWTFIHANSVEFQKVTAQIPYELDVLLIDGDHSRAGVLTDCEYIRQVRPGGIVLFHDIAPEPVPTACADMSWPGDAVRKVYESLCRGMAERGWTSEIIPGRYGLGVLRRPVAAPTTRPTQVPA